MTDKQPKKIVVASEIEITLKVIGGKYKAPILYFLIENGSRRFSEIQKFNPSISQKTLSNQLRELERDELISRSIYPEVPPRVDYSATEKGRSLYPILEAMCAWGEAHMDDHFILLNPQCTGE